jgi:ADP-heptose:LPS heptosyltransferase
MASVFFIAPFDLAEAVLATGALAHVLGKDDRVTIACERPAQALFRALPQCGAMSSLTPGERAWTIVHLTQPFDLLLDLRDRGSTFLVRARRRMTRRAPKMLRHLSEEFADIVGSERAVPPSIPIDNFARVKAAALAPGPLIVLAPGGSSAEKRWAPERFAAAARRLHGGPLANAQIVAVGAGERDHLTTSGIVTSLDADGVPARDLGVEFDLLDCAALMERATLVIGNDNVLTHIAAAVGAPTLTLFGPTDERVRAPYGPRARTLRGRSLEEVAALDAAAAMSDISIDAVEATALDLLHAGGLR